MNKCLQCGKELIKGQTKFCCSSCSATYNNNKRKYNTKGKKITLNCVCCGKEIEVGINSPKTTCKCQECKQKNKHITYNPPSIKRPLNMSPKTWGNLNELLVAQYVISKGYSVSFPFGENDPYDQIWDVDGRLLKIQIKSPDVKDNDTFSIRLYSGAYKKRNYINKVDYIVTYYEGECYCVSPNKITNMNTLTLRTDKPKNNMLKGINSADEYKFDNVIIKCLDSSTD